jgi:hypothetical protein
MREGGGRDDAAGEDCRIERGEAWALEAEESFAGRTVEGCDGDGCRLERGEGLVERGEGLVEETEGAGDKGPRFRSFLFTGIANAWEEKERKK